MQSPKRGCIALRPVEWTLQHNCILSVPNCWGSSTAPITNGYATHVCEGRQSLPRTWRQPRWHTRVKTKSVTQAYKGSYVVTGLVLHLRFMRTAYHCIAVLGKSAACLRSGTASNLRRSCSKKPLLLQQHKRNAIRRAKLPVCVCLAKPASKCKGA